MGKPPALTTLMLLANLSHLHALRDDAACYDTRAQVMFLFSLAYNVALGNPFRSSPFPTYLMLTHAWCPSVIPYLTPVQGSHGAT